MLLAVVLGLMLAAADPVTIYVGPNVRDGFVDVDSGVLDSIEDIKKELAKDAAFKVVTEKAATLRLYVMRRTIGAGPTIGFGSAVQGTGTTMALPINIRTVETLLRVGSYERAFFAEDHEYDSWRKCAQRIAKDLAVWLTANRERVGGKE